MLRVLGASAVNSGFLWENHGYNAVMTDRELREREWLQHEVRWAASLSDADRIRILRDLLRTADAIRNSKTAEELERDDEVRRRLEEAPGLARYAALAERLG